MTLFALDLFHKPSDQLRDLLRLLQHHHMTRSWNNLQCRLRHMIDKESAEFWRREPVILPADDECSACHISEAIHDIEFVASDEIVMHAIQSGAAISLPPEFDESG